MRAVEVLRGMLMGVCAAAAGTTGIVQAQTDFPTRPMRLINPYSPGGSVDVVSRALAAGITEAWHMQVIVDNRPGAGTTIGTEIVSRAEPDGYTMLVNSSAIAIMPTMYSKLSFSTTNDLTAVNLLTSSCQVLVVHPAVPVKTVKDLIALSKSQPGKISGASSGVGRGACADRRDQRSGEGVLQCRQYDPATCDGGASARDCRHFRQAAGAIP
jgi:tripartite-type tricarboxylate transporter receptor subunit TctC